MMSNYSNQIQIMRQTFKSGRTLPLNKRKEQLQLLRRLLIENCDALCDAVHSDLKKCYNEVYCFEILITVSEIEDAIRYLNDWAKPRKVYRNVLQAIDKAYIVKQPLGIVLIISPWNYPIQLLLAPLVGALAAGNCAVLKPSEFSPATSSLICELIEKYFDSEIVYIVTGGASETQNLLNERFDHIFFTGSTAVGRKVMEVAARTLTPVTLELGGKCPVIVDKNTDISLSAKRIAWGKLIACGQTCLAPDYIFCHQDIKTEFLEALIFAIVEMYGQQPQEANDYGRIINLHHYERIVELIKNSGHIVHGGIGDSKDLFIPPTILDDVSLQDPVMKQEIFGPVLPILSFQHVDEAVEYINQNERPLALYLFTNDQFTVNDVIKRTHSGGVTVNDVIMHMALDTLPFGGIGSSGMGRYHGKFSFDCFTHEKAVLHRPIFGEILLWMRYPPYSHQKLKWAKRLMIRRSTVKKWCMYFVPVVMLCVVAVSILWIYV